MNEENAMAEKRLVQLSLPEESYDDLTKLAADLKVTRGEVMRHSLEVYKLLRDSKKEGKEVILKKGDEVERLVRI